MKYKLYQRIPGMVLGFHGCDAATAEAVLAGGQNHLHHSRNKYDWLGHGIYFWENDPRRALEFAIAAKNDRKLTAGHIEQPTVVGAVIDLGNCLNLLDRTGLQTLKEAYTLLKEVFEGGGKEMPKNLGADRGARRLDCAVIEAAHVIRKGVAQPEFDTVRGAFWEGGDLYPGAGFQEKNHVQIAVRKPASCILGYFRPRTA